MDDPRDAQYIQEMLVRYLEQNAKPAPPEEYGWNAKFSMDGMDPMAPGFIENSRQNAQQGNVMGRAQRDPWDRDTWGDAGY